MTLDRVPVEPAHVLMFARAIGDVDPVHHDDEAARERGLPGAVAPPTFLHAAAHFDPEHHLRPRPGVAWHGSGAGPGHPPDPGAGPRLHAEQHYRFARPVRAGETLHATARPGETWEKEGRAGVLRFSETITEYRDDAGELVAEGRSVAVVVPSPTGAS